MRSPAGLWLAVIASLGVAACASPRTVGWGEGGDDLIRRTVEARAAPALHDDPPGCVAVKPPLTETGAAADPALGETVARHLTGRVDRVIGPFERRRTERRMAVSLSDRRGEVGFARAAGCDHVIDTRVLDTESVYALVWTRAAVGLHLRLRRAGHEEVLWEARHVASRSDGGLPLSPVSAVVNVAEAGMMANDDDLRPSLTDDALRRIVATLDDFRGHGGTGVATSAIARRYGF